VNGTAYYVMPFVEGESLRDRLNREKQLPIADAVRIASEVASALDAAHRHGVIHRDIKPENILLHDGTALVADFGIALAVSAATNETETGLVLGTPQYMSSEQAASNGALDSRSDVYSLGVVMYEMLVGHAPWDASTARLSLATRTPPPLASVRASRPEVPEAVAAAVACAVGMQRAATQHLNRLEQILTYKSDIIGGAIGIDFQAAHWSLDHRHNPITIGRGVVNACRLMDDAKAGHIHLTNAAYQKLDKALGGHFKEVSFVSKEFDKKMKLTVWELRPSFPFDDSRKIDAICQKGWED